MLRYNASDRAVFIPNNTLTSAGLCRTEATIDKPGPNRIDESRFSLFTGVWERANVGAQEAEPWSGSKQSNNCVG